MKNNIKKIIKEDFNNSYSFKPDMDKILEGNNIETNRTKTYRKKGIFKLMPIYQTILLCCLCLVSGLMIRTNLGSYDKIITDEFVEYVETYEVKMRLDIECLIRINENYKIYIYNAAHKNSNSKYYFYIVKSKKELMNYYIIIDNTKTSIASDSFGLLKIIDENTEDKSIKFSIEINGEIKDFVLN